MFRTTGHGKELNAKPAEMGRRAPRSGALETSWALVGQVLNASVTSVVKLFKCELSQEP